MILSSNFLKTGGIEGKLEQWYDRHIEIMLTARQQVLN